MDSAIIQSTDTRLILRIVSRIAAKMARCLDDADDITQDVMLKLLRSQQIVPTTIGWRWLLKVTHNAATDYYRNLSRDNRHIDLSVTVDVATAEHYEQGETPPAVQGTCASFEESLVDCDRLSRALATLNGDQRRVMLLVADGYTYAQIADVTGSNIGTVRSRLHHARRTLRDALS